MRFALNLAPFGPWSDPHRLVALAGRAEAAGWDGVFLWDHVFYGEDVTRIADPWVCLAAMAAATTRLRIGTMVTPLPRRRPAKLARETVTLDHLSGGRLTLGVGIGWPPRNDFGRFGDAEDNRVRGRQLDEGLEVLTALWSGEDVVHRGDHYLADGVRFLPRPIQRPRIPIWVAGMWPHRPAFRRAARFDGVFPIRVDDGFDIVPVRPDDLREIIAFTLEHRDTDDALDVSVGGTRFDDPDLAAYERAGATWWQEWFGFPTRTPEEWMAVVDDGPPT
ncbi:MAG: LLM class flavin-dependent oxidoreductase [Acidimicrobiia bacterium]|nr:LLM class flavin-dependent oxidoreductase [Acidimicrobiia bacterium]